MQGNSPSLKRPKMKFDYCLKINDVIPNLIFNFILKKFIFLKINKNLINF